MSAVSARRLRALQANEEQTTATMPDPRAREIGKLITVDGEVLDAIHDVFAGTSLMEDQAKVRAILQARGQVAEAWRDARNAYLEIGRALNAVDQHLDQAERDAMKRGFGRLFPFSETVASQFRRIARAVDEGRLPLDVCPASYTTAYQLALLTPGQMQMARERGLLRANVSRHAIMAFRREVKAVGGMPPTAAPRRAIDLGKLEIEARRLETERRGKLDELLALRRRLREVRALMEGQGAE
jgi:hypothetical protein